MDKFAKELIEHFLEVAWAFFIIFLLLAGLAVIFGRSVGYDATFWGCLGFALLVAAIFAMIVLGHLLCIGVTAICRHITNRDKYDVRSKNNNIYGNAAC
jgi:hypothetical protein